MDRRFPGKRLLVRCFRCLWRLDGERAAHPRMSKKVEAKKWTPRPKKKRPGLGHKPRGMKSGLTGKQGR
jgi:hypothetical protein